MQVDTIPVVGIFSINYYDWDWATYLVSQPPTTTTTTTDIDTLRFTEILRLRQSKKVTLATCK